jgi:hypothetical protein
MVQSPTLTTDTICSDFTPCIFEAQLIVLPTTVATLAGGSVEVYTEDQSCVPRPTCDDIFQTTIQKTATDHQCETKTLTTVILVFPSVTSDMVELSPFAAWTTEFEEQVNRCKTIQPSCNDYYKNDPKWGNFDNTFDIFSMAQDVSTGDSVLSFKILFEEATARHRRMYPHNATSRSIRPRRFVIPTTTFTGSTLPEGETPCATIDNVDCCIAGYGSTDGVCRQCEIGQYQASETLKSSNAGCKAQPMCGKDQAPPTYYASRTMSRTEHATNNCKVTSSCSSKGLLVGSVQSVEYTTDDADIACFGTIVLCDDAAFWSDSQDASFDATEWTTNPTCTSLRSCAGVLPEADPPSIWANKEVSVVYTTVGSTVTTMFAADRVCSPRTSCSNTQYISNGDNIQLEDVSEGYSLIDNVCTSLQVCSNEGEFESVEATSTSDRGCRPLTAACTVGGGLYELIAPTSTSNRYCAELQECASGTQFELVQPTAVSDRQCSLATECVVDVQYEIIPLTTTSNRECDDMRTCAGNEFESVAPTSTSDRKCATTSTSTTTITPPATSDSTSAQLTTTDGGFIQDTTAEISTTGVETTVTTAPTTEPESTTAMVSGKSGKAKSGKARSEKSGKGSKSSTGKTGKSSKSAKSHKPRSLGMYVESSAIVHNHHASIDTIAADTPDTDFTFNETVTDENMGASTEHEGNDTSVQVNTTSQGVYLPQTACSENYHVVAHLCTPCRVGTTNLAGNHPMGDDTECDTSSSEDSSGGMMAAAAGAGALLLLLTVGAMIACRRMKKDKHNAALFEDIFKLSPAAPGSNVSLASQANTLPYFLDGLEWDATSESSTITTSKDQDQQDRRVRKIKRQLRAFGPSHDEWDAPSSSNTSSASEPQPKHYESPPLKEGHNGLLSKIKMSLFGGRARHPIIQREQLEWDVSSEPTSIGFNVERDREDRSARTVQRKFQLFESDVAAVSIYDGPGSTTVRVSHGNKQPCILDGLEWDVTSESSTITANKDQDQQDRRAREIKRQWRSFGSLNADEWDASSSSSSSSASCSASKSQQHQTKCARTPIIQREKLEWDVSSEPTSIGFNVERDREDRLARTVQRKLHFFDFEAVTNEGYFAPSQESTVHL